MGSSSEREGTEMNLTLARLVALAEIASSYRAMRVKHPNVPAVVIHGYLRSDGAASFEEFCCPGHEWAYTGTAYIVKPVRGGFGIFVREDERRPDGSIPKDRRATGRCRKTFAEPEDAEQFIEDLREFFENDYDDYLEENHAELARMEQYEAFLNER